MEVVRLLLEAGDDVNAANTAGCTAMMGASHYGDVEVVRWLLEAGADVNAAATDGHTALMPASMSKTPWVHVQI